MSNLAAEYHTFGIGLGILASRLDEIRRQREAATTVNDKFTEVVRLRLSRPPPPTWKTFIDVAKSINRALAQSMHIILEPLVDCNNDACFCGYRSREDYSDTNGTNTDTTFR